jgi:hypothetical protein
MEVHHRVNPAENGAHTNRKKWTHYFWEFLMLFLAITLGFLVENRREHYIEHLRAKEYAALMHEDLKKDTAFFQNGSGQFVMIKEHQDSLLLLLQNDFENVNRYDMIRHWINSVWALNFTFHEGTYEQMKSSGSLRYIRNIKLVNSIQEYYNGILPDIRHYHNIQSELTENRIVPFIEDHINYQEADFLRSTMNSNAPEFFDWNKRNAIKLYNMIALLQNQNQFLNVFYIRAIEKARETMQILKKQYHLE